MLTPIGLFLDIVAAILIVLGNPPVHKNFLLKCRKYADKYHPIVSKVKQGYDDIMKGSKIYRWRLDAIEERVDSSTILTNGRIIDGEKIKHLYRASILRDNFPLLGEEFSQPFYVHGDYVLYKIEYSDEFDSEEDEGTIDFVHKWVGPEDADRDEKMTLSQNEEKYEENLKRYLNSQYTRIGSYLLVIGFVFQLVGSILP